MKKKFKLFATIASISMSLALMVFGVIAATSVNVTINSNVSYTAEGVAFKLYGKSELLGSQPTGSATDLTEGVGSTNPADTVITVGVTNVGTDDMTLPDQTFTAESTWVVYTFTVENIGSNPIESIYVSCSANDPNVIASNETPTGNLAQGDKESFRCFFKLDNINASIQNNATSVQLMIGHIDITDQSYMAPESLAEFTRTTSGNTTTWTKGPETFSVTSSTSGTTVTETNTFTNGDKTTRFSTTYDTSTVQASASQTFSNSLSSNYIVADRTLRTINITSGDNTKVVIPDWLNIKKTYSGSSRYSSAFYNLQKTLQEVVLPSTLKTIGGYTFYNCSSLTSIEIPAGVTRIEGYAFYFCSSLTAIEIPAGVTSIGTYAFNSCSSLTSIEIPTGVKMIESFAFNSCRSLTSIVIPTSVNNIGNSAFKYCYALVEIYNLSSLNIAIGDNTSTYGGVGQNAKVIHTSALEPTRIVESNGVKYYNYGGDKIALAPTNRAAVTSVTLDDDTTEIYQYAFYNCSSLTSIEITAGVTSIEQYAFDHCTKLDTVTFASGSQLISIGEDAFNYCSSLTAIEIPAGVTSIEEYAFRSCSKLTSAIFADPEGWSYYSWGTHSISSSDLANASTAATYLTDTYNDYPWEKG